MRNNRQKILIVDDVPENIDVIGGILSDYKRIVALSGKKALEKAFSENPPDLILLDIMMPDMDGYEVCRQLRAGEKTKDIPVIFITAKGDTEAESRGFDAGAVDYITKPVNPPIVRARVKTHLELKNIRETLMNQNRELTEAAQLREDVERITRHDLKTPLNAIIGMPRVLLNDKKFPDTYKEFMKMIEEAGLVMLNMINLSLDLFRMERGNYDLRPVSVDIVKTVTKVFRDLESLLDAGATELLVNGRTAEKGDSFMVQGEELLCYSMLSNLIRNAGEASSGEDNIRVELEAAGESGIIRIHNRESVPEEIRDTFFDKYVSAGKSSGTGLGTYSARLIAITQGGSIDLESSEEKGTTVTVCLPVRN